MAKATEAQLVEIRGLLEEQGWGEQFCCDLYAVATLEELSVEQAADELHDLRIFKRY